MITLWELKGRGGRPYSSFSWRTKMALRHKGLDYDSIPVPMTDKAAIAFSGGKTVPIIKDGQDGEMRVVRDSWKIAEYLEETYSDRPSLFGGAVGKGLAYTYNTWADRVLLAAMMPVIVTDLYERIDPSDETYFRQLFEGFLGCTLEEHRPRVPKAKERLSRILEPMQSVTKRQRFVCGESPAYGDYILFSIVQWARIASPQDIFNNSDPLYQWRERMLDLYDGFARKIPVA